MSDREEILTRGGPDRGGRFCRCHKCGAVERCTPSTDFYVRDRVDGPEGPLYCQRCIFVVSGVPPDPLVTAVACVVCGKMPQEPILAPCCSRECRDVWDKRRQASGPLTVRRAP